MTTVEAVYQNGLLRLLTPVPLAENQRVSIDIKPSKEMDLESWYQLAKSFREQMQAKYGTYPDSTFDIATDRLR